MKIYTLGGSYNFKPQEVFQCALVFDMKAKVKMSFHRLNKSRTIPSNNEIIHINWNSNTVRFFMQNKRE